jgi:DNA/RNA-binding domain of Phe-tRNA-synthetase-like protein
MPLLSIEDLTDRFPEFRVAFVIAEPLGIGAERGADLAREIAAAEDDCRRRWGGMELSAIPEVAAWRAAYKGFGIKRTSYRSSAERLIKRVLAGQPLPQINALVDLYNMVSLETGLCLGCDDLDKTSGALMFRFATAGDTFVDMGAEAGEDPNDPAQGGGGRLRRRSARPLPALELASGRAQRLERRYTPGGADGAVKRGWRRR